MNSVKIIFIIISIIILFTIIYLIKKKKNIETFSKKETIKLINQVKNSNMSNSQLDKCIYSSNKLNDIEDILDIINNCNPEQDNIISNNLNYENINQKKITKNYGIYNNYILPTYLSNLELIKNENKNNNQVKKDLESSKYNLSNVINPYEQSQDILNTRDNQAQMLNNDEKKSIDGPSRSYDSIYNATSNKISNDGFSRISNDGSRDSSNKNLSNIINKSNNKNSDNDFIDHSGRVNTDDDIAKNKYKSKDGVNLFSILGKAFDKLMNSNIGKLFLEFLSKIDKLNILKIMEKSVECSVKSKLVGLEKGTCLIGEDKTCFWNRQILEANNNVRCQCGSDNSTMSWFNSLAEHEAKYAKELATKNKCKIQSGFNGHTTTFTDPKTKKTYKFSENIAISGKYSSSASDRLKAGESAVNGWASEGIGKNATKNDSSNYTAMNWNTNTLVGCGSEYCSDSENYITVCAYTNDKGEPGNTYSGLSNENKNKKISENVNCQNPIFLGL